MAKQLNVSLAFTADIREAKAQLQDLQKQLNNILKTPSNKLGITDEIREAISATAELSSRLQQATNVNTGNLDFSKFNNSLKQSGQSLSSYGQQLQKLGPTGQQAFLTLTKSIATAEIPIKRTNALVKEFATTLANTARWQISSSVLHGLMGSMQSAYRYAQDLNESLNDIRIVTGQSVDQMARFAAEANAAAKALSATTVEYTNASLIYYQQGLSDQQVKERTDITIKMANVSKQSAEVVSDQMTAVWNNFYNGSKSLEYYADVMTALGAATASSADEISGGLEKFAAIGETIGLSYEYAAAALATITSNTRQSEEVVGTALKTIFARIQGLNLGETLEDGTTLNKYSAALEKVGISIFDSAGELKKMDTILDEMGSKWETLNKAQQTALAQTVAGTRQYTQLVALMDNWDKGDADSMQANLTTAYNSSGALQEQANIYAESWEAARDRVTAAAEKIYSALLNDDFFIDVLNGFEKILTFVSQLIDNLGGLQGVFLALGAIVTKVFSAQISQGLTNMAYNMKMMTKSGRESVEKERRDFIEDAVNSIPQSNEYTTEVEAAQQDSLRTELTLQMEYMDNAEKMSSIEADTNKKLIERTRILKEHTVELNKRKSSIDDNISNKTMSLRGAIQLENEANPEGNQINYEKQVKPLTDQIKTISSIQAILQDTTNVISAVGQAGEQGSKTMQLFRADLMSINTDNMSAEIRTLINEINQMGDSPDPVLLKEKIEALNFELEKLSQKNVKKIKTFVPKEIRDDVDNLTQSFKDQAVVQRELNQTNRDSAEAYQATIDGIHGAKGAQKQWSDVMVESANVAFNVASAISMVSSAIDTLKDPDVSGMQKLVTVLSTMGMVLPTIISLIGTMKKLFSSETVAKIANAAATWAQVAAEKSLNKTKGEGSEITKKNIKETWQDTVWKSTKKENQDKYIEQILKDKGYVRDQKTGGWGKTTVGKKEAKRFDPSTVISNDDAVKMATPDAQKMAGKGAFKALGSKIASSVMIAAGIAVIIGTVAMAIDQMTKAEQAVAKAKDGAKVLVENYDTAKASYDNLISAQSQYETATNGLDGLTKGTVAYQEALLQANEAASELLATNKDLTYTIENGQIVIDKDSLEQVKANELKKVESAQAAKIAGQRELIEAEENLKKRDVARNLNTRDDDATHANNTLAAGAAGAAAGALIGSAIPIIGTALGAVVGGLVGVIGGAITTAVVGNETEAESDALEKLEKAYLEDDTILQKVKDGSMTDEEWKKIGIEDSSLIQSLEANGAEVAALVEEMAANTAAINTQNDLVASNVLSDNEAVQKSDYRDQIVDIAGDAYGHAYDKAMESEWVNTWGKDGINKATGVNQKAEDVFAEYLKYAGLEGQGYELTDTTGTDDNRKFIYKDQEGNEHTVSLEAMQAARAAYEASSTLDDSATKLAATFDKLANSSNEADAALLSFVSGKNFENAKNSEFKDIQAEVGSITKNDDGTFTAESLANVKSYLDKSLGETLTNDVAIRYGYESANAMVEAFATKLSNADEAWGNINIPSEFKFADDMSLGIAQALEKQIEQMNLGPLGEKAGEDYVNALNSMLGELDTEDQQKALSALTAIDWSDWNAMEQAEQIMKDLGIEIDTSSAEWQEFIENMRLANGAMPDFSQIKSDLNEICAILDKLDFGSAISEENYARLIAYNDEWERFFILQANGTRKFIGNAADMKQAILDSINEQRKELEYRKKIQEGMDNAGWSINGEKVDWHESGKSFDYVNTAQNLMNASGDTQKVLEELEYTDDTIQEMINEYNEAVESGDKDAIAKAEERFKAMYNGLGDFMEEDLNITDAELDEMVASTATSIEELNQLWTEEQIGPKAYSRQLQYLTDAGMMAATSLGELYSIVSQGLENGATIDYNAYADALMRIGGEYSNTTAEIGRYQEALESGNEDQIKSTEVQLKAAIQAGEMAKKYGLTAEHIERYADELKTSGKYIKANEKALTNMAKDQLRFDKAVESASENMDDWTKALKTAEKTGHLASETADEMAEAYGNLLDIDGSELSSEFLNNTEHLEDMKKALQGDEEAYKRLQTAARQDIATKIGIDDAEFQAGFADLMDKYYQGQSLDDLEVGASLDNANFLQGLSDMVNAAGMTAEEATNYLSSMGVDAEVVTKPKTVTETVGYNLHASTYTKEVEYMGAATDGGEPQKLKASYPYVRYTATPVNKTKTTTGTSLEVTSASKSSGGNIKFSGSNPIVDTGTSGGGGGGGGGTSSTPAVKKKKSDVVDRYKEVTDKINLNTQAMNKASKAADNLYGKARINNMKTINELLTKELELLAQKRQEAEKYLDEDKLEIDRLGSEVNTLLTNATAAAGITLESMDLKIDFDPNTNLMTDSTTVLSNMVALYNQLVDAWTQADGTILETNQEQLDKLWESIEEYKSATEQYDETLNVIVEVDERSIDITNEQLENNYDAWKETLELKLGFNESDLEYIEYQLGKVENSVYGMSEAIGLLSDKGREYEDNLIILGNAYKELNTQFENGQISSARYYEELSELRSQIIENLEAIRELDEAVEDYYSNTLSMAQEEISKVIDLMDNATNVLDHYYSLMDLFGKQKDFDKIGKILNAQATVSENVYKASSEAYKMFRAEADARKTDYNNAITEGASQEEIDRLKNRWIEAENAAAEAQDRMLSDAEAWAEDLNSILENDLAKAADTLENALTGTFGSFDELISQLDRANSLQEEFLTTTNKIYETNKLIRNAQKEIDKTTNSAAKRELKNFINKTNELQQQGKLSQYELEIQQAKYDLLLAEIALKEAQNAKSTVRLQRDSEGNFGYVYTADQNAITDAQQKYEDAQNALYNIGLEGANNYTQRYIETMSEMYDTLTEIQQRDDLTEEERKQARLEATNYYYQKLKDYSYLHQVALTTDSRVAADAWSKDFAWMTESTETWMTNVNTYTTEVDKAITLYLGKINAENGVAKSLESLAENTDTITKKSKELKDMIGDDTKGLIYALEKEFDAVHKNVLEYEALRKEMQKTIDAKESFANSLLKEQKVAELIGSTVYYALNGQTLRFDDYNAETGEVLVSDPETGNNMWVDERLIASSNSTTKKEVGSKRDNLYNYNYTDVFGGNQNFNARRYSAGWDINHLAGSLKRNNYGFGDLDFFDYYNKGYLTDDEVEKHKDKDKKPKGFDTGGYTGEWGPYGKMAMLHEKELVLNQHDTENLLASMEFLTRVLEIIDLQSLNNQLGGSLLLPSTLNTESNTLEQNVHIEASFPNVVDHSEIELAFNDLINISSQYANRK